MGNVQCGDRGKEPKVLYDDETPALAKAPVAPAPTAAPAAARVAPAPAAAPPVVEPPGQAEKALAAKLDVKSTPPEEEKS